MSKEQEYSRLNEAEKVYRSDLATKQQFLSDNPYALRSEDQYLKDPIMQAQRTAAQRLHNHIQISFKIFDEYRKALQKKYKFEFPIECYGDSNFADYFKQMMRS